jgi:hypothetical protein
VGRASARPTTFKGDLVFDNKVYRRTWDKQRRQLLKERMYDFLGGPICACCGETNKAFLTLDHVYGDGAQDNRGGGMSTMRKRLRKVEANPDRYQILCYNCNCGKRTGLKCPHEYEMEEIFNVQERDSGT